MKRLISILVTVLTVLIMTTYNSVYAWQTGGQAGGGGSSGGGTSILTDGGNTFDSGTYLFQLVYKPQNGNRSVVSCAVVYSGQHKGNIGDIYSKAMNASSSNRCQYVTSGVLKDLALQLYNGANLDNIPVINDKSIAQDYVGAFGVDYNTLTEPGSDPGTYNSYGYRILIQKLTCFGTSGNWCQVLYPRKDFANDYPNNLLFGASYQNDLYTTKDDIGISNAAYRSWHTTRGNCWGSLCDGLGRNFADANRGEGFNIIGFNPQVFNSYDYTIDAACTNCQDTTSSGSFIIQDINNWEAIEASNRYNGDNANIRTYYYKNDNTYCREEIKVDFPDTSKVINVQTGRYFTVGASENDIGYSLDKNFGDISVTRTRECQGAGATSYTQSHPFGTQTEAEGTVDNGTGIVTLKYTENILNGSQYDKDEITLIAKDCQESINAGTRTMTCKYGLPNYVYRYVKDGQSLYDGRNDSSTIDLGIPNLPISFNNYSTPRATVQLAYELPNDSQLKKSYIKDNTYLNSGDVDNIYKKYIEGSMNGESDQNELNKSACAKLYGGTNTAGFRVCAQNRTNNKIGNDSSSNCVTRNTLSSGNLSERYICPITGNDENGKICEYDSIADIYYGKNGTAVSKEQFDKECDGSPNDKICKYDDSTDTYYGKNGTVVSQEQYYEQCPQECTVINGVYYGKMNSDGTGRKVTQDVYAEECLKYCTIETVNGQTIYYDLQGNASTDPNVEGGYNDDCVSKVTCPPEQCEYGCCPDGSCADSEGNCPFTTPGNNIIYRPIDLINPFPSQNAMIRATGSNWCAYNIRTNKIDCSADNAIVKAHINNNRSTDDYDIYSSEPLYEVVLTPDTIKAVRNYNNRQEKAGGYGDYTLNCNGTVGCYSTFLREEGIVSFSGECSKLGSLKTCAERR